jgi:integrase
VAIKTYLTPAEITAMIGSRDNLRDQVILTFLADSGVRVSELLSITPANVDLERREVSIPHLKRGTKKHCPKCYRTAGHSTKFCSKCGTDLSRVIPEGIEERTRLISIGEQTASLLKSYLARSQIEPDKPIFPISRQMIFYMVRDAASAIGLTGKLILNPQTGKKHYVHPHDLRTALAVSWLEYAGSDATKQKALQDALGHKSFDTTQRYNKLTPGTVRNIGDEVRKRRFGNDKRDGETV